MSEIEQNETWPLVVPTPLMVRKPNAELAWRALDTARSKGKLEMGSWFEIGFSRGFGDELTPEQLLDDENACGTTACHAGWVVALSGYTMRDMPGGVMAYAANGTKWGTVMDTAQALLGIDMDDAYELFLDSSDDTIEETITEIFGPRPEKAA